MGESQDEARWTRGEIRGAAIPSVDRAASGHVTIDFELATALLQGGAASAYVRLPDQTGLLVSVKTAIFTVAIHDHLGMFVGDPGTYGKAERKPALGPLGEWSVYQLVCQPP